MPFAHAESLAASLPQADLVMSEAGSHLLWFSDDYPSITARIERFLTTGPR